VRRALGGGIAEDEGAPEGGEQSGRLIIRLRSADVRGRCCGRPPDRGGEKLHPSCESVDDS